MQFNDTLPMADEILEAYKKVFYDKPLSETDENLMNWFITTVIPIIHVASRAKNNWRPFAFVSGAPASYSTFVTSSDEAFALFMMKHYRSPPPPTKRIKMGKMIKKEKEKQQDKDDNEEEREEENERDDDDDDNDNEKEDEKEDNDLQAASKKRKRIYKKKIDIKQGEKDYKKWMNQLKTMKSSGGKQLIDAMDKRLSKMIQEYKVQLAQQGYEYDASAPFTDQDVVNVVDSDDDKDYVDLETVGI